MLLKTNSKTYNFTLRNIKYIPESLYNLVSIGKLAKAGLFFTVTGDKYQLTIKTGSIITIENKSHDLYPIKLIPKKENTLESNYAMLIVTRSISEIYRIIVNQKNQRCRFRAQPSYQLRTRSHRQRTWNRFQSLLALTRASLRAIPALASSERAHSRGAARHKRFLRLTR